MYMEGIKVTPEWMLIYGLDHFSTSQLTSPLDVWLYKYLLLNQQERRALPIGSKAHAGNGSAKALQLILAEAIKGCSFMMCGDPDKKIHIIPPKSRQEALAAGLKVLHRYLPWNEKQREQRFADEETLPDVVTQGMLALEPILKKGKEKKIYCEEYISLQLEGVLVPIIGRLDFRRDKYFIELKTKWRVRGKIKKDGTRSWSKKKAPTSPDPKHVQQVAIYWKATGYKPYLVYVGETDFQVFSEENCDMLKPKFLEEMLQEIRAAAMARQKILQNSSSPKEAAGFVAPGWESFYWDIPQEWLSRARELWRY
jgi:hypothetical protein